MPTTTPVYSFKLPLVADPTDEDQWGGLLNQNFSDLDVYLGNRYVKTASFTALATEVNSSYFVDATAGNVAVTLATPTVPSEFFFKKTDASTNTVTISTLVDGAAYVLDEQYSYVGVSYNGTNWSVTNKSFVPTKSPTYQYLTSGTTYNRPTGVKKIRVRMVGGGGGGGAYLTNNGVDGGVTSFNSITASGGQGGGTTGGNGGQGGTGGSGTALLRIAGGAGGKSFATSSSGGSSFFGGAAGGGLSNSAGTAAAANSGSGGGGGGTNGASASSGAGGGAGEYVEFIILNPTTSYTYAIGVGGNGGAAGTQAGGNGGSGLIIVEEFYSL